MPVTLKFGVVQNCIRSQWLSRDSETRESGVGKFQLSIKHSPLA